jgi:hypothetical protein
VRIGVRSQLDRLETVAGDGDSGVDGVQQVRALLLRGFGPQLTKVAQVRHRLLGCHALVLDRVGSLVGQRMGRAQILVIGEGASCVL